MKRIILITLVIAIASTFAFAALQTPGVDAVSAAGQLCPTVGWNTRGCNAYSAESLQPDTARLYPPVYTPNVGWNT